MTRDIKRNDKRTDIVVAPSLFLTLQADESGENFTTRAPAHLCVGRPDRSFLFGGAAIAAGLEVVHQLLQKPLIYAAAQFATFGRPDDALHFHVHRVAMGNSISQAQVTATANGRPFLSLLAAVGSKDSAISFQALAMPPVPPAEQCQEIATTRILSSRIEAMFELRPALGRFAWDAPWSGEAEGPVAFWARARDGTLADYRVLAELADLIAIGLPSALGRDSSANSLDNHIRFGQISPSEWVLCAIHIQQVSQGLVHGQVHLFHPEGTLLAIASQSMLLRLWKAGRQNSE